MYRELLHIWGPFSINSFGLFIALGLSLFTYLLHKHPLRKKYATDEQLFNTLYIGIIATLLGGRLLYVLQNMSSSSTILDFFVIWNGGLSILGGILSCLLAVISYFLLQGIPVIPFLDIVALYAPLAQMFGRIGCFCAGCCHGIPCNSWHAITYTDGKSFAPINTPLHPTQLYSAFLFLMLFCILFLISRQHVKPGILIYTYLILSSSERFMVDFWRADREFIGHNIFDILSLHQWIALLLIATSLCLCLYRANRKVQQPMTSHESI